jgi:hypothetical protein
VEAWPTSQPARVQFPPKFRMLRGKRPNNARTPQSREVMPSDEAHRPASTRTRAARVRLCEPKAQNSEA